ncbi:MAG: hypothetical protein ABI076_13190 [Acidobacteriaceae bacterium]
MNLHKIPGADYPIKKFFSNLEMPAGSPYRCAWWYRKQFQVPAISRGKTIWLRFGGINYRANIWANGRSIANSKQIAGPIASTTSTLARQRLREDLCHRS